MAATVEGNRTHDLAHDHSEHLPNGHSEHLTNGTDSHGGHGHANHHSAISTGGGAAGGGQAAKKAGGKKKPVDPNEVSRINLEIYKTRAKRRRISSPDGCHLLVSFWVLSSRF